MFSLNGFGKEEFNESVNRFVPWAVAAHGGDDTNLPRRADEDDRTHKTHQRPIVHLTAQIVSPADDPDRSSVKDRLQSVPRTSRVARESRTEPIEPFGRRRGPTRWLECLDRFD